LHKFEFTLHQEAYISMSSSGSAVLKKIFKWPHPIFAFLWLSPLCRGPDPLFQQFWIPFTHGWFVPSLIVIGLLVLEEKILFKIWTRVNMVFPIMAPSDPWGPWFEQIWMNLQYIRKLSCKYELVRFSGNLKKIFKWPHPFLWLGQHFLKIIFRFSTNPPLKLLNF
jgi:hypothetical protein